MRKVNRILEDWLFPFLFMLLLIFIGVCNHVKAQAPFNNSIDVYYQGQLNDAMRLAELAPIAVININGDVLLDSTVRVTGLVKSGGNLLTININGTVTCKDTFSAFVRHPANDSIAEKWMIGGVLFRGGGIYGKGGGTGIELCASFGGGVRNCYIYNFNYAVITRKVLSVELYQCRAMAVRKEGFVCACGDWPGATQDETSSNVVIVTMCRVAVSNSVGGMDKGFACYYGADVVYNSCTVEAGAPNICFYYKGGNTSKQVRYTDCWIECVPKVAGYKMDPTDGDVYITSGDYQKKGVLVDASGAGSNSMIVVRDIAHITAGVKWVRGPGRWHFENVRNRFDSATNWKNGLMPAYYSGESYNTLWNHSFPGKSFRYNGEVLDSLVKRVVNK